MTTEVQIIDATEYGDQVGPEFPSMPKFTLADFGVGTEFVIKHNSYAKRRMRVYKVESNYIMCEDLRDTFPQFCLTATNLAFYAKHGLLEITKYSLLRGRNG
jgi:hypothetical protein